MSGATSPGPVDHVLLTRFNVVLPQRVAGPPRGLDPAWLSQRIALFETWTAPSVRRQTGPQVPWLVLLDAETPRNVLGRLETAVGGVGQLVPLRGPVDARRTGACVAAAVPRRAPRLLTTRLDSDDALAPGTLAAVRARAEHLPGRCFVNPRSGLQAVDGRVFRRWDGSSPFLSHAEPWPTSGEPPRTVFCVDHYAAALEAPLHQLGGGPWWVQTVHAQNVANGVEGLRWPRDRAERALGAPIPAPGPHDERARLAGGAVPEVLEHAVQAGVAAGRQAVNGYGRLLVGGSRRARRALGLLPGPGGAG